MSARTITVVQARMSSTRLPAKALIDLAGRPLLWHAITRAAAAGVQDEVVVATSTERSDDPIVEFCGRHGFSVFRGSLEDVLDRFHGAAEAYRAERIVRVTADCPLLDPEVVAQVVGDFDPARHDYVSNTVERTFPDGLDTEVFSFDALERAWREASVPSDREHVTPYIWKRPDSFRIGQVRQTPDLSAERWTVDEPRDLEFVRAVFREMGRPRFGQGHLLELLERKPWLRKINAGIESNEGYRRSLRADPDGGTP